MSLKVIESGKHRNLGI